MNKEKKEKLIEGLKVIAIMTSVWISILIQGLLLDIWDKDYGLLKEIIILGLFAYEWMFITIGIYYTIYAIIKDEKNRRSDNK